MINKREHIKQSNSSQRKSLAESMRVKNQIGYEKRHTPAENERHRHPFETLEIRKYDHIKHDTEIYDWEDNRKLIELGLQRQNKQINWENEMVTSENKCRTIREETSDVEGQKDAIETEDLESVVQKEELTWDKLGRQSNMRVMKTTNGKKEIPVHWRQEEENMETIPPETVG